MTSSLARAGKALVAFLTAVGLVFLSGCAPFLEHPPRASDAWEAFDTEYEGFEFFVVASRHYGPSWGRIDGEDVIVFGYREGFDRSGGLPAAYGGSIYVIRADGTKLKRLSPSIGDGRGLGGDKAAYDISPDVSPDGRWLAYATHRHGNRLQIVTFELDGRGKGRIDGRGRHLGVPAWAPDGNTLAFSGLGGFTIAEPDGSNRRVIARGIVPARERPSWSPDGNLLAFRSLGDEIPAIGQEGFILHIAAVDGSSVTAVGTPQHVRCGRRTGATLRLAGASWRSTGSRSGASTCWMRTAATRRGFSRPTVGLTAVRNCCGRPTARRCGSSSRLVVRLLR